MADITLEAHNQVKPVVLTKVDHHLHQVGLYVNTVVVEEDVVPAMVQDINLMDIAATKIGARAVEDQDVAKYVEVRVGYKHL